MGQLVRTDVKESMMMMFSVVLHSSSKDDEFSRTFDVRGCPSNPWEQLPGTRYYDPCLDEEREERASAFVLRSQSILARLQYVVQHPLPAITIIVVRMVVVTLLY